MVFPAKKINVFINPSFETSGNCTSSFPAFLSNDAPGWAALNYLIPVAYFNSCTNFVISDSLLLQAFYYYWAAVPPQTSVMTPTVFPIVPQPIPDGDGVVGITDASTRPYTFEDEIYKKSYVGTCLTQGLMKDSLYRLDFYLGFGERSPNQVTITSTCITPPPECLPGSFVVDRGASQAREKIALFGATGCSLLSSKNNNTGCLAAGGWFPLGTCTFQGVLGSWVKGSISFKAPENISALAIGPSCDQILLQQDTNWLFEYFLDDLQLFTPTIARPIAAISSGSLCNQSVTLEMQPAGIYASSDIHWYRNDTLLQAGGPTLQVTANNNGQGYYECQVENDSVCLFSDSLPVFWEYPPNVNALGSPDTLLCDGQSLVLDATSGYGASYTWQDGSTQPTFTVKQAGLYSVNITNDCGTVDASKTVQYRFCADSVFVPNAFTPNGDGINDIFLPVHYYIFPHYSLQIFNRYGEKVFFTTDISKGWDGYFKGNLQPAGTYVYAIRYQNNNSDIRSVKGTVILIR
jgi:gliding motility-associated-like protein